MANVKSAEKRNRQRVRRRERNLLHKTKMRTLEKRVRSAIATKDAPKATEALKAAVSQIAKAAQRGVIKSQTASRHISRLTTAVTAISR